MAMVHWLPTADASAIQQAAGLLWWGVVIFGAGWCDLKVWKYRMMAAMCYTRDEPVDPGRTE